jgi:hypothetical protein
VCVWVRTRVYVYVCECVFVIYMNIYTGVCVCLLCYLCVHVCTCVWLHVCVRVCNCVCVCVCMCVIECVCVCNDIWWCIPSNDVVKLNPFQKIDRYFETKMAMDIFQSNNIKLACLYNTRKKTFLNATSFLEGIWFTRLHFHSNLQIGPIS